MKDKERIEVYVEIVNGKTKCVCHAERKGCRRKCERTFVIRDKFDGWEKTFQRDRYGK